MIDLDREDAIQASIQISAPAFGCILMRNNSGALVDNTGRPVRYGLGNVSKKHQDLIASSDLIGITTITITPDMVGKTIGVFTAVEVKRRDWKYGADRREKAQLAFVDFVKAKGGFAGFANSLDMFKRILGR